MLTLIHELINNFPNDFYEFISHAKECLKCFSFWISSIGTIIYIIIFGFNPIMIMYPILISLTCAILEKITSII